ncbi:MAG: ferrous iron transport protein B [Clostridia bacterium]|nr:ferrous iron transport protein B [Clostridia bacterium]
MGFVCGCGNEEEPEKKRKRRAKSTEDAAATKLKGNKLKPDDHVICLAGNPNTGKSTVFNALTGMHQHTGNWPGKTVATAEGRYEYNEKGFVLVDLPGTYSLLSRSPEEEVASDFVINGGAECCVVVCESVCLERNLILVQQCMELHDKVIVCVNLMDEAKKHGITVDADKLSEELGCPVVLTAAGPGWGLKELRQKIEDVCEGKTECHPRRLICTGEESGEERMTKMRGTSQSDSDVVATKYVHRAERISADTVTESGDTPAIRRQRMMDKLIMGKLGIPIMILLLFFVFWFTLFGADYLTDPLQWCFDKLYCWNSDTRAGIGYLIKLGEDASWAGWWYIATVLVDGVYVVATKVIAVMLPPMAIFFPIFSLLEDFGYLPRVAFRLDNSFRSCGACGKQSLTMCMGFGCNAAGVVGCRIIDSERERKIAILTNNFVPCNGRFPTLTLVIGVLLDYSLKTSLARFWRILVSALVLVVVIIIGIFFTFGVSKFLTKTMLKGEASSFVLELPPYRKPQVLRVIGRSIWDRTLKVLGRAVTVAAPAGALIAVLSVININGTSMMMWIAQGLNPIGTALGFGGSGAWAGILGGALLVGFVFGLPANEIVIPITVMIIITSVEGGYTAMATSMGDTDISSILIEAGLNWKTCVSIMMFSLLHWPCATTILSVKNELNSWKWAGLSALIPTVVGIVVCLVLNWGILWWIPV